MFTKHFFTKEKERRLEVCVWWGRDFYMSSIGHFFTKEKRRRLKVCGGGWRSGEREPAGQKSDGIHGGVGGA